MCIILFRSHANIWFGMERERALLKLSEEHLNKIIGVVAIEKSFTQAFLLNDVDGMEKAFKEIFRLEREADERKENIIVELSKGPFHPIDREDIMRLSLTMDDIATNIKSGSRKLLYLDPSDVPDEVKKELAQLANMVYDEAISLGEAHKGLIEGSKEILKLADKVERKEEDIDEFRVALIANVLNWGGVGVGYGGKDKNISNLLMLKEAIENFEEASDRMEDVADIIRGIVAVGV